MAEKRIVNVRICISDSKGIKENLGDETHTHSLSLALLLF